MSCRFSFLSNLAILLYLERVSIVLARCLWTCLDVWSGKKVDISFIRLSRADRVDEIINSTPDVSEFFSHHEQPEGIADWKSMKLYLQPVLVLIQHFHCVPFVTFNLFLDICFSFFFFWQFSLRCYFFFSLSIVFFPWNWCNGCNYYVHYCSSIRFQLFSILSLISL